MSTAVRKFRQIAGVLVRDLPRYLTLQARRGGDYLAIRNRDEQLKRSPDGDGYLCLWQWTSDLHAPRVFPSLGRWLFRRAFDDHPIRFSMELPVRGSKPEVTFIIGHRGMERMHHLTLTLASIAGQIGVSVECIVVEQDVEPRTKHLLPEWVTHVHAPPPQTGMPYNRSMAFNRGVQLARSELLILHDNDMPVPQDFAAANLAKAVEGYEVVNLKRFIFYLDQHTTHSLSVQAKLPSQPGIEAIVQNTQGGGSIAISREAYFSIGGMDESFVGWGGEDNEFWERAATRRVYPYGFLPLLHMWHEAQPEKGLASGKGGAPLYHKLSKLPLEVRIKRLQDRLLARHQEKSIAEYLFQSKGTPQ